MMIPDNKVFTKLISLYNNQKYQQLEKEVDAIVNDAKTDKATKAAAYLALSQWEERKNHFDKAFELTKKAKTLNPEDADINKALGSHYAAIGERKKAEQHFRKSIELKNDFDPAWYRLSHTKQYTDESDPDILQIKTLLKKRQTEKNREMLCFLNFALGKIHDDLKQYQQAIEYYFQANFFKGCRFNPVPFESKCQKIKEILNTRFIQKFQIKAQDTEITPVFIVGMARSGSSLIEQILTCHSQVSTVGEGQAIETILSFFPKRFDRFNDILSCFDHMEKETLEKTATHYLQKMKKAASNKEKFIINKTPSNYLYLGLIKMMFPNAKIIHTQRHPGDTCLSCFFTNFDIGNLYSFDAAFLGYFYRKYDELMIHWHNTLKKNFIYNLPYEALVTDSKKNISQLLSFCGLKEEAACFKHHKTKRHITTASNLQASQPIYKTSVQRWKNYQPWLQSLLHIDDLIKAYETLNRN